MATGRGGLALEAERLSLEPVAEPHAALLAADLRDPRIYRFMTDKHPPRPRELRARFREVRTSAESGGWPADLQWAARSRAERRYVGIIEAEIDEAGRANLGYLIFPRAWRRGYALEACRRVVAHLFDDRDVASVGVITALDNGPARALAERLGLLPGPTVADDLVGAAASYALARQRFTARRARAS